MARSRTQLRARLERLAEFAVQGTLVEVYLRCGTASCGCHRDPDRRHGPHLYLKFRDPQGRATSLYVPRAQARAVQQAARAWREAWETLVALGQLNRQALRQRLRRRTDAAAGR
jgi:hypothetical protein